jgi:hypothetical protein
MLSINLPAMHTFIPVLFQFDAKNIRKVVLMNKAGDALVTGSGWIADGMIKGGNALARRITL